ncbi:hypothetical protein [Butyrivibrio sp. INlla21]|uniref:hypothetical protein n=1 Tax=Butyrivibrio sp. INlla21 TaxID=1520811 RepID=UPI0008DF2690|nr:hypothetical protein [Butyrivibrio sp. INlla21]SFU83780.1 hypothetical protein SAMN02910342_01973 [Butyrivibrio sp. INlla21]
MNNLLFVTGCSWIVWAGIGRKIFSYILEKKIITVCYWIFGFYNIFLAFFGKGKIGEVLLIIDFVIVFVLDIYFLIIRLKKGKKGALKIYQLGLGFIFIIIAVWMLWLDVKKIHVSIATLTGAMMMLSVPFQEFIEKLDKEKNNY